MTNIEQQFFKTFGIEPIEYRKNVPCLNFLTNGICNITDERCNPSKCNHYKPDKNHKNWRDFMEVYPEITDRILLELICLYEQRHHSISILNAENIEILKNLILKTYIQNKGYFTHNEIQQLFKEEE